MWMKSSKRGTSGKVTTNIFIPHTTAIEISPTLYSMLTHIILRILYSEL